MPRSLEEIATEIANDAVSTAQCAGYEIAGQRAMFFRSDLGSLEGHILDWLEEHMEVAPPEDGP